MKYKVTYFSPNGTRNIKRFYDHDPYPIFYPEIEDRVLTMRMYKEGLVSAQTVFCTSTPFILEEE